MSCASRACVRPRPLLAVLSVATPSSMALVLPSRCAMGQLARPFLFAGASTSTTGWAAADPWAHNKMSSWVTNDGTAGVTVVGVAHYSLVVDFRQSSWGSHRYERFDTRGKMLSFHVDQSGMQCRCAGTLYFGFPRDPDVGGSNACGINSGDSVGYDGGVCTEVDIMEANVRNATSKLLRARSAA